jgi:hypothetical protein
MSICRRLFLCIGVLIAASTAMAATSLEVVLPDQSTTGVSFAFTVTARTGAAVDTAYTGTVHFTSSDPSATLPADYTFTPADAGTHTFNATMATSGDLENTRNQSITATDTATSSIQGTDVTTVKWAPDVVRRIVIQAPDEVDRTVPFEGTVIAWNADYQPVPGYTGTVHFSGSTGLVLPADYTFTPADAGTHTFTFTANRGGHLVIAVTDVSQPQIGSSDGVHVSCPELTATASNSGPVCANSPAILIGSSNQSDVTYSWSGPRGWFSFEQNPTAPGPGMYFLTVEGEFDCSAHASTEVLTTNPPDVIISGSDVQACGGEIVTATVENPTDFTDFHWGVSGGELVSGQGTTTVQVRTSNAGNLVTTSITVSAQHVPTGCPTSQAQQVAVDVDQTPVADITAPASACPNATLTASVPNQFNVSYGWTAVNATITVDGPHTIEFVPNGAGDVTLTATVYGQSGRCTATDTAVVSIGGPSATLDADLVVCPGEQAVIPVMLSGTPPFQITWSDGLVQSGIASTQTTRTVTPAGPAVYTVTAVSDALCTGSAQGSASVTMASPPAIIESPRNMVVSRGETATLTVEATGADLRYDWYEGQSGDHSKLVSSEATPEFTTPPIQGTTRYWVEVVSACGGSVESSTATVAVSGRRRAARH